MKDLKLLAKLGQNAAFGPLACRTSGYQLFHESSKYNAASSSRMAMLQIASIRRDEEVMEMLSKPCKLYSLAEARPLQIPEALNTLEQSIHDRRSVRRYTGGAISLGDLSRLLFFMYGQTQKDGCFRAVASGGALYPLEVYVFAFRVEALEPGLYHYAPQRHGLDFIRRGDYREQLEACITLEGVELSSSCMLVVISGVFIRSTLKYGDRGYRMVLMECGEAGQNLSLMATSMGLGSVWLGGFMDDRLNRLLEIDGVEESALAPMVVGRRA
ncbi:SagB/ThcOx family dehydrogenase [Polyangium jinanense]|uniref:SagB/ThcOx family dehydrogenase n=1 Tax=Polyangium jinanense TaxID=2829994 RepID=A0A9X3X7L8_9BACT|nr:SagB/ThcOx family dehydrogenase [Polyangium jinanense]MDC3956068.1 SagB/ThcOx family dehydrogenase [Polyangium jinanense]MDC3982901.1 SagB/ThcOx family dehydrogenase [Polyangium jinanense]